LEQALLSPAEAMVASSATLKVMAGSVFALALELLLLLSFSLSVSPLPSYSLFSFYQGPLPFYIIVQ